MKQPVKAILLLVCGGTATVSHADILDKIDISGFGSVVAGKTLSNNELFTADWHDVGQYDNDVSFKPESVLAIQGRGMLAEDLYFTAQLVAKGVDDFEPEFDWYYLTYNATDSLSFMAGRRSLPMYYFSEFYEVGFAYPWIRPPANLYWWQVNFFDGIHASYEFYAGDYTINLTGFYGNEEDDGNKLIGSLYNRGFNRVEENWMDITGFNAVLTGDFFDLRFVYFTTERDRIYYNGSSAPATESADAQRLEGSYDFYGLGGSVNWEDFVFYFDYNFVQVQGDYDSGNIIDEDTEYPTLLLSLAYTIGDFQPYVAYSKADQNTTERQLNSQTGQFEMIARTPGQGEEDYEQHELYSIGVRYNYTPTVAVKFQYDSFKDQGFEPAGWAFHGDSETLSVALDFIF